MISQSRSKISSKNSLEISNLSSSDSGHYACTATNQAGLIKSEFHITVLDLPHFLEKPKDQTVEIGGTRKLTCSIDGDPPPITMWRLPGLSPSNVVLHHSSDEKYSLDHDGSLVVNNLNLEDTGVYTCMGTNSGGGIMAKARVLAVEAFPPPIIGFAPQDQTIIKGGTLNLPCVPASESSESMITWWYKRAVHLPERQIFEDKDNGVMLSGNFALVIRNSNRTNSGIYTCKIESRTGKAEATALVKFDDKKPVRESKYNILASPKKPRVRPINSTTVRLIWQPNSNSKNEPMSYLVEYWRYGWDEWRIAVSFVQSENVVITELEPDVTYTFLVRCTLDDKLSFPSPWSDPIRLDTIFSNRIPSDKRFERQTLTLTSAVATSPSNVLLSWESVGEKIQEYGVLVYRLSYYKGNNDEVRTLVHVSSVLGNSTSSSIARGLQPSTDYTFFVVPFWKEFEGTPSNSIILSTPYECKYQFNYF